MSNITDNFDSRLQSCCANPHSELSVVNKPVGSVGYGLMGLTWLEHAPPQEQCFKAMRTALAMGANLWNGGEIYGTPERNSLHLLNEYFSRYPDDAAKVVLSIKGGYNSATREPDGSEENVMRSIDECLRVLNGKKFLDLFQCARFDPNIDPTITVAAIDKYVRAGKIGGISLSEVSESTIRKCAKVAKISAVEVEFSLWSTDILRNGVAQACADLSIPIVAYSPLGRGFLTGSYQKVSDVPERKRHMERFHEGNFDKNLSLIKRIQQIATRKGVTPAQTALAWVRAKSESDGLPIIIPIPGASHEDRVIENLKDVSLSDAEVKGIDDVLRSFKVSGGRYWEGHEKYLEQ